VTVIPLTPVDLGLAALGVVAVAAASLRLRLGVERPLLVAAARSAGQLLLVGLVLRALFAAATLGWVAAMALLMLAAAAREVRARQTRRLAGGWSFGVGAAAMFVSSFSVAVLALLVMVGARPWWEPQYAIPLLGMLLGNTMTGVALGMERVTHSAVEQRAVVEERLLLGATRGDAIADARRASIRAGLIPIVNSMAAAGLVSLPGMMTGQILAGSSPLEAVKYQILILFLIAAGTGGGTILAVTVTARRLFDERHRLRLDRLVARGAGSQ
jgi:putative ABC transport system permease protein